MPDGLARARCPHCDKTIGVRPDQFGRRLRCPGCRMAFVFEPDPDPPAGDGGGYHPAADADELAVVTRRSERPDGSKAKLTARFDRPRELVFRAAVQAVRGGRCDVVSVDWANAHLRFAVAVPPAGATEHDLFVFEGANGAGEVDITSRGPNDDGQFDPYYQAIVREVGKYLMFAPEAPAPVPPPAPLTLPRGRDVDDDDRPRYRPRRRRRDRGNPGMGFGIAGMVCGIVGVCFFCIPLLGGLLGVLGVVFGAIGYNKGGKTGNGFAVAGIATGLVACALALIMVLIVLVADRREGERGRRDRFNQAPTRLANTHRPSPSA